MRIEHGYLPANRWRKRPLDERWRQWLTGCACGAVVVGVAMAAFVGPRQTVMRMRYEIAQLTQDVDRLEREQRHLLLERESLTSPSELAREAPELGLEVTPRQRVAYFTADDRLLFAPATPTPAPARKPAAGGARKTGEPPAGPSHPRGARTGEAAGAERAGAHGPRND
jgi:hypothetical protein